METKCADKLLNMGMIVIHSPKFFSLSNLPLAYTTELFRNGSVRQNLYIFSFDCYLLHKT